MKTPQNIRHTARLGSLMGVLTGTSKADKAGWEVVHHWGGWKRILEAPREAQ